MTGTQHFQVATKYIKQCEICASAAQDLSAAINVRKQNSNLNRTLARSKVKVKHATVAEK